MANRAAGEQVAEPQPAASQRGGVDPVGVLGLAKGLRQLDEPGSVHSGVSGFVDPFPRDLEAPAQLLIESAGDHRLPVHEGGAVGVISRVESSVWAVWWRSLGPPSITAISPKYDPDASVATSSPSEVTSAVPFVITKTAESDQ